MERVLFICTGNYYRSRFAEAIFNHEATKRDLDVRAFSRGLATWMVDGQGIISANTVAALKKLGVSLSHTGEKPLPLTEEDLGSAYRVIALKEVEHRPMMLEQFPAWASRIDYWHVHDIDFAHPAQALPEIHSLVMALIESFALSHSKSTGKSKKKKGSASPQS